MVAGFRATSLNLRTRSLIRCKHSSRGPDLGGVVRGLSTRLDPLKGVGFAFRIINEPIPEVD